MLLAFTKQHILNLSKLKAFAEKNQTKNVARIRKFSSESVENIVGKGENAVYQFFLFFPQCF